MTTAIVQAKEPKMSTFGNQPDEFGKKRIITTTETAKGPIAVTCQYFRTKRFFLLRRA